MKDHRRTCECGHRYHDHPWGLCLNRSDGVCDCQRWEPPMTQLEYLTARIAEPSTECMKWPFYLRPDGYGSMRVIRPGSRRMDFPHRVAYEIAVGPIPKELTLDHLCREVSCFNPAHLEAVSIRENTLRGNGSAARRARQTHCIRGHEFTPENTRWNATHRERTCIACTRLRNRRSAGQEAWL